MGRPQGIKFGLHESQREVFNNKTRFTVLVAGRRWGKTHFATVMLLLKSLQTHQAICCYIAPSFRMAKNLLWPKLMELAPLHIIKKVNEADPSITLVNGSKIILFGADNPDSLRGLGPDLVVIDEYDDHKKDLWDAVIRPSLIDRQGEALFIGTPKGFKSLYSLYKYAGDGATGWSAFHFPSAANPVLQQKELDDAKANTDPRLYKQEYEASFEHPSNIVYDIFSDEEGKGNVQQVVKFTGLPIIVGMDFNVDPFSMVVCQYHSQLKEFHVLDEIVLRNSHTAEAGKVLRERFGTENIEIWCDATGNARSHNIGSSDFDILRSFGFEPRFTRVKEQSDKYNAVRAWLLSADGHRTIKIHPKCTTLLERIMHLSYDDTDDHITDSLAYAVMKYRPTRAASLEEFYN